MGLLRGLVLGVDRSRARARVRLHARVERILGLGFFLLFRGVGVVFARLAFSFFFFFFSGTGSPAAANLFFSALRAALRSALALAFAVSESSLSMVLFCFLALAELLSESGAEAGLRCCPRRVLVFVVVRWLELLSQRSAAEVLSGCCRVAVDRCRSVTLSKACSQRALEYLWRRGYKQQMCTCLDE